MNTYTCKCGKTLAKNTTASTTGNRMPDYGPGHECYGCPFVCEVMTWDPMTQSSAVANHECRASPIILYHTTAALSLGDKCTGRIYSLDFDFLHLVREYADGLDGIEPDRYSFSSRAADYCDDGRYKLTIYPSQNNAGILAKKQLFDRFFYAPSCMRKDKSPEGEKQFVLEKIKKAKEAAQSMSEVITQTTEKFRGTRYADGRGKFYFVGPCEDNKYRVFFGHDWDRNHDVIPCGNIPKCETQGIAQQMLDDYAARHEYEPLPEPDEQPAPDDTVGEMEQPEYLDISQYIDEDIPLEDEPAEIEQGVEGGQDTDEGMPEEDKCDEEKLELSDQLPDGPDLSLRLPAFDVLFNAADSALLDMSRTLKTKYIDSGELTIKVVINNYGGILKPSSKSKVDCVLKTAKVSIPIYFSDDAEFTIDENGRVFLPDDRQHQLSFDETLHQDKGFKTMVDGKTGLVEKVESAGQLEFSGGDEDEDINDLDIAEEPAGYPCGNVECPFWGLDDDFGEMCCFEDGTSSDADYLADVSAAVTEHNCCRDAVLIKYSAVIEGE